MSVWEACGGARNIEPISGTLYRLVESQEQVATLSYVDTLEEQEMLEALLEGPAAVMEYIPLSNGGHALAVCLSQAFSMAVRKLLPRSLNRPITDWFSGTPWKVIPLPPHCAQSTHSFL